MKRRHTRNGSSRGRWVVRAMHLGNASAVRGPSAAAAAGRSPEADSLQVFPVCYLDGEVKRKSV